MLFREDNGYQNFLNYAPALSSIILESNKKVTNWILSGISSEKIEPFDTNLEPTMSNLANGRVNLKSTILFWCKKILCHCIATSI